MQGRTLHRHISPHPLDSPGEPQTSIRECSLWQTLLNACSIAPDNRAALLLSAGILPDKGKIKETPYCFKSLALLCAWPRKGSSRCLWQVSQRKVVFSKKIHTIKFRQTGRTCNSEDRTLYHVYCEIFNTVSHLFLAYVFLSLKLHVLDFVYRWQATQSIKSAQNLLLVSAWQQWSSPHNHPPFKG